MSKMKNIGIIIGAIAIVALVILLVLSFAAPAGFWMGAEDSSEYDHWAKFSSQGDSITVSGKIGNKEESSLPGTTIYSYKFKDCKEGFYSSEDIGDEGDRVTLIIKDTGLDQPEVEAHPKAVLVYAPNLCCGIFTLILIIIGLLLFLIGMKKAKKAEETKPEVSEPTQPVQPQASPAPMQAQMNQPPQQPPQ